MPAHDQRHRQADEDAERHDHHAHRHIELDEQRVEAQHQQHRDVFIEVLHRNRVAGGEQHVPAVLQQRVHRHHEEARHRTHDHQEQVGDHHVQRQLHVADVECDFGNRVLGVERHQHDDRAHCHAHWQHVERPAQGDLHGGSHGARGHPYGDHGLQNGTLREVQLQRLLCPLQHDELQRGARSPEQRRHRQGNLAQPVVPQGVEAVGKLGNETYRILFLLRIACAGIGNARVEQRRDQVDHHDHQHGRFGRCIDALKPRNVERQQPCRDMVGDQGPT